MVFICHVAYDLSFRIFTMLSVKILSILPLVNSGKKLNLTGFAIMILVVEVGGIAPPIGVGNWYRRWEMWKYYT